MKVTLQGDTSSHGGSVSIPGPNATVRSGGRLVCILGARLSCPIHGLQVINPTSPTVRVAGLPIVRAGDSANCGAVIVANSGGLSSG